MAITLLSKPGLILLCQIKKEARHTRWDTHRAQERVSSAMDGKLRSVHAVWISAIPAEMTDLEM
jgi:hypothetical protein